MRTRTFLPLAALIGLAACAETKEPDPNPAEDGGPYDMIDPVPDLAPGILPAPAAGEWAAAAREGRSAVRFGPEGGEPALVMLCDERGGIVLERRGLRPTGPYRMMQVTIGNERLSLAVNETRDGGPVLRATLPFNSRMHTLLKRNGGPMIVTIDGGEPLALPPSPLVAELAARCTGMGL